MDVFPCCCPVLLLFDAVVFFSIILIYTVYSTVYTVHFVVVVYVVVYVVVVVIHNIF